MDPEATLAQLRIDFEYRADGALDAWRVPARRGPVRGDCEEFALALAFRLAGRSWLRFVWHLVTFQTVIWHCAARGSGRGHVALWHRGAGWADNIYPAWAARTRHRRRFPWLWPLVGFKLLISPLFRWVSRTVKRAKGKGE